MREFDWQNELLEIRFPLVEMNSVMQPADNFLKVKETLTRIGAPGYEYDDNDEIVDRVLWQSCHILHKRQKFYIVHFKEMCLLDGNVNKTNLSDNDLARRNRIALLLQDWKLIEIVDPAKAKTPPPVPVTSLKIISFSDKKNWILDSKYTIGKFRKN